MILTVITWIASVIGLLILAVLLLPVRVFAGGIADTDTGLAYRLVINWSFGLVTINMINGEPASLCLLGFQVWRFTSKKEKKKKPEKKKHTITSLLKKTKGNLPWIHSILKRFVGAAFLKGHIDGRIGLSNPADTALIGLFCQMIDIQLSLIHI